MIRRLLNLLTAVSLMGCVLAAVLWGRSLLVHDVVQVFGRGHWVIVHSSAGVLSVFDNEQIASRRATWEVQPGQPVPGVGAVWRSLYAFDVHGGDPSSPGVTVTFPWWTVVALLALLPAGRLYWRRVERRRGIGRCPSCGYDLRATPERCPECGWAPA